MHRNTVRVSDALKAAGFAADIRELPDSAATSADAAAALGVPPAQIAKSLVFVAGDQPILVVLRGSDRLDTQRLAAHLGVPKVRRADADVVRAATGFPIGGVSPVGHATPLRVLVDTAVADEPVVWAAAGTPHAVYA
ncbi:MAG: YbaK/EbsC family protein, partial [Acidimicrobiales bacterium]